MAKQYKQAVSEALAKEAAIAKAEAKTAPAEEKPAAERRARIAERIRDLWGAKDGH